ncbi:uncharacterized protein J3D65DRAFT_666156 [Phyllosticta citribraziliensis]|uniref:C2H2-type domain-containing protein n=1 Tax=Phyllosticta citribraziliensis TaxID=989973 RepID=A0ABR1M078_9PEZI
MPPPPTTTPQPPAHLAAESTFTTNLRAALRAQTTWHAYIRAGGYSGARRILSEQEFNAFRDGMQPFDRCGFERRVCEMEEGPRGRVKTMEPQSSDKQTSRSAQATFKDLQPAFKGLENAITQLGDDLAHAGVAKYRQIGDLHRRVRDIVDILSSCSENLLRQYEAREREMEQLLAATRDMVSLERLQRMSEDISGLAPNALSLDSSSSSSDSDSDSEDSPPATYARAQPRVEITVTSSRSTSPLSSSPPDTPASRSQQEGNVSEIGDEEWEGISSSSGSSSPSPSATPNLPSREPTPETAAPQAAAGPANEQSFDLNGEGRFECAQCHQTYGRKHNLQRHLASHSDERPFMCAVCGERFARSDVLAKHTRTTHGVNTAQNEAQEPLEEAEPEPEPEEEESPPSDISTISWPTSPVRPARPTENDYCLVIGRESANRGTHSENINGTRVQVGQEEKRSIEREKGRILGQRLMNGMVPRRVFNWISATYEKQSAGQNVSWMPKSNPVAIVRANMAVIDAVPQGGHLFIIITSTVLAQKLTEFTLVFSATILATYMRHIRWTPFQGLGLIMIFAKTELYSFFVDEQENADLDLFIKMLEHESHLRNPQRLWLSGRNDMPGEDQDDVIWVDHGPMG